MINEQDRVNYKYFCETHFTFKYSTKLYENRGPPVHEERCIVTENGWGLIESAVYTLASDHSVIKFKKVVNCPGRNQLKWAVNYDNNQRDRRYVDCIVSRRTPWNHGGHRRVKRQPEDRSGKFLVRVTGSWRIPGAAPKKNDRLRPLACTQSTPAEFSTEGREASDRWRNDSDALSLLYRSRGSLVSRG